MYFLKNVLRKNLIIRLLSNHQIYSLRRRRKSWFSYVTIFIHREKFFSVHPKEILDFFRNLKIKTEMLSPAAPEGICLLAVACNFYLNKFQNSNRF